MRIAEVVCVFPPYKGGIGKTALEQARGLSESGEEVEIFTPDYGREKIADEKFKINYLKPVVKFGNAAFLPQLMWRLKDFEVVILHHPFFGTNEVIWLAKKLGCWRGKLFIYYHMDFTPTNLFFKIFSWPSKVIFKSLFKSAKRIMAQSIDYLEHSAIKNFYLSHQNKFVEIPLGTNLISTPSSQLPTPDKFILFVGSMDKAHYFKGVEVLLRAFSILCHSGPRAGIQKEVSGSLPRRQAGRVTALDDSKNYSLPVTHYTLRLVGDGDLRPSYEKLAQDLDLPEKVKFLGKIDGEELNQLYQTCEFLVLPSINSGEAFGLVLVEAMAAGKAVIASNLPGVRTVCQNGINGLLVRPNDAEDLAEKMKILLIDEELKNKLGEAGRKLVEERFNWQRHTEKIVKLLNC